MNEAIDNYQQTSYPDIYRKVKISGFKNSQTLNCY